MGSNPRPCGAFSDLLTDPGSRTLDRTKLLGNSRRPVSRLSFRSLTPLCPPSKVRSNYGRAPARNKKQRKPDQAALEVIAAVRSAYGDLTGYRGARAILSNGGPAEFFAWAMRSIVCFAPAFFRHPTAFG